ncbi:ribonuclease III [Aliterella atlantica]|uniref:Ribonuclease 3 n=1 Tax=Aliterella atlantica CENA595 TaxID=1618023 RepID=A0A0D8ZNB8_9CYAN|nr:ribonuclease III [Aliterella atlantica]KJH69852.1 ribonuclease III [Aliterella atlantica CENA595]
MSNLPTFKNPELLRCALTHSTYMNEYPEIKTSNERLEFLGDALLGLVVAKLLYEQYPEMNEGKLSKLRSALVDEEQLAKFAENLNLGSQMLLGKGEKLKGGVHSPNLLSSTFEAVIGAYFLDSGLDSVNNFIKPLFIDVAKHLVERKFDKNFKSILQEWSLATFKELPKYNLISESGPDHNKVFLVEVCIQNNIYGEGEGNSKKEAEKSAAEAALKKLGLI